MRPELSLELETSPLHAVLDGLALHAIAMPQATTPGRMRNVLRAHLDALS
jgi:BetI-type transcriptional repressor, C-terminal